VPEVSQKRQGVPIGASSERPELDDYCWTTEQGVGTPRQKTLDRGFYFEEMLRLQDELVKLEDCVLREKLKVVVLFEGRDAAGRGGTIRRVTRPLNPRVCRTVVLTAPTERQRTQWCFQRYVAELPGAGEIVLFDRSWYNRAGVERLMGFCTETDARGVLQHRPGI
jgi:polyphosphate kinase 2 (PPK2 family)